MGANKTSCSTAFEQLANYYMKGPQEATQTRGTREAELMLVRNKKGAGRLDKGIEKLIEKVEN